MEKVTDTFRVQSESSLDPPNQRNREKFTLFFFFPRLGLKDIIFNSKSTWHFDSEFQYKSKTTLQTFPKSTLRCETYCLFVFIFVTPGSDMWRSKIFYTNFRLLHHVQRLRYVWVPHLPTDPTSVCEHVSINKFVYKRTIIKSSCTYYNRSSSSFDASMFPQLSGNPLVLFGSFRSGTDHYISFRLSVVDEVEVLTKRRIRKPLLSTFQLLSVLCLWVTRGETHVGVHVNKS